MSNHMQVGRTNRGAHPLELLINKKGKEKDTNFRARGCLRSAVNACRLRYDCVWALVYARLMKLTFTVITVMITGEQEHI